MADAAGVDGRRVGVLWVEDHGLVRRVDLLTRHGERARPAWSPEIAQKRRDKGQFDVLSDKKNIQINVNKYRYEISRILVHFYRSGFSCFLNAEPDPALKTL